MSYEFIRYEVNEGIATITLNRPEIMNAMHRPMNAELVAVFEETDRDDDVRVVVMTGEGKAFCAGGDISGDPEKTFDKDAHYEDSPLRSDGTFDYSKESARDGGGFIALKMYQSLKPIIGAINGVGAGVGASMTLPMDIRIGSERARLAFVYARRGLVYECCASWFLPRIVGIAKTMEWSMRGHVVKAAELKEAGLLSEVVPQEQLMDRAYDIAREIADNTSPVSVALMRQMAWRSLGWNHPMEGHRIESRGLCVRGRSDDVKEGVGAFLEKRQPNFPQTVSSDMPDYFPWWEEPKYS